MSTVYTVNIGLGQPSLGDTGWAAPVNANFALLDSLTPIGALCCKAASGLNVAVAAGQFRNSWGSIVSYAGTASFGVPASQTTRLWLTNAGVLSSGTSWPTGSFYVPVASVVAGSSAVTSVADARVPGGSCNVQSQPTMGAATASGTYGSGEAAMLNAVYSAVRALGLGT